jgi:hypothetical protein
MTAGHDVQRALSASVATDTGATLRFQLGPMVGATAQVGGITSATVLIEGRMSPDAPFVQLATTTANGVVNIPNAMVEMRARVSVYVSGTIDVWIMA